MDDTLAFQFPDWAEFEGQPIEETGGELKIESIALQPMEDGQRVVVGVAATPTRQRPDLEIVILAPDGRVVAETCIVESHSARQVVTMHLRPADPLLTYTVRAGLFVKEELIDTCQATLTWPQ
jgi:hypothetical protein